MKCIRTDGAFPGNGGGYEKRKQEPGDSFCFSDTGRFVACGLRLHETAYQNN